MAISIGDALLKLRVDKKDFDRDMKGIGASIKKHQRAIGIGMAAMGAAILAAGAMSVKQFASMGDEVQKMALRTGFSTEALSELRHAADLSGTSLASLEKASKTLSGAILDAGFGLETYVRAFEKVGLTYEQLKPLSPEEQFIAVMEALAGVTDESERAALAADLFGRAGTQLLPMLADGTEGLAAMRQEAHDLGIVFDQEAANKAAAFNDALTKLKGSVSGIMMEVGSLLVDALKPLIDDITEVIKKIKAWTEEHPALTKAIVNTGIALGGLLVVMGTLIVLKIPALIAALITWGKVLIFTVIPAVWGFVTALWAQVTATLAAMAATGVLIPAAIAAVAAIALLATGITLLVKNQKEQYESTNAVTEAIDETVEATGLYTEGITGATDATVKLRKESEKLAGSLRGTVADAYMYYATLGRPRTAFEREQIAGLGRAIGIPGFAGGGIVTSPTLAMLGEGGPEAVVPLGKGGMVNIYVELDGRILARAIGQPLVDEIRLRTGARY